MSKSVQRHHLPVVLNTDAEILIRRFLEHFDLDSDVQDLVVKQIYKRWRISKLPKPIIDKEGFVVHSVKNISRCEMSLVSMGITNRSRWIQIASLPGLHRYDRRVCIWESAYYDISQYNWLTPWNPGCKFSVLISPHCDLHFPGGAFGSQRELSLAPSMIKGQDRHSEEWIGFRQWAQTNPAYIASQFITSGHRSRAINYTSPSRAKCTKALTHHWFGYELASAYPTLYGKKGWAVGSIVRN